MARTTRGWWAVYTPRGRLVTVKRLQEDAWLSAAYEEKRYLGDIQAACYTCERVTVTREGAA